MSPYSSPLIPINDVSPYFKTDEKTHRMLFTGESLELRIPMKFETYGALINTGDSVTTPGVCDMIINDKYHVGLSLLTSITIHPSEYSKMTYDGVDYLVLKLKENDIFISNTRCIQDSNIVYILWSEIVAAGNCYYWLDYNGLLSLFENVRELTGAGLGVSRSVYEGIIAHLARDKNDISKQYRLTNMTKPMQFVALKSISHATTGTLARINGSYMRDEGLTSALRRQVNEQQPFENILRAIRDIPQDSRI